MASLSMDSWVFLRCHRPLKFCETGTISWQIFWQGKVLESHNCGSQQFGWQCHVIRINVASKFSSIWSSKQPNIHFNEWEGKKHPCVFYQLAECCMTGQALHLHYLGWIQQMAPGQGEEWSLLPGKVPMFYVFWQDFPRDNDVTAQVRGRRDGGGGSFNCHRCGPGTVTQNTSF